MSISFSELVIILFSLLSVSTVNAEVHQCQADCREPSPSRLVGPTRPWYPVDQLGNELGLTRPYPFSIAGSNFGNVRFNVTFVTRVDTNSTLIPIAEKNLLHDNVGAGMESEREAMIQSVKNHLNGSIQSFHLKELEHSIRHDEDELLNMTSYKLELVLQIDVPNLNRSDHEKVDEAYLQTFDANLKTNVSNFDCKLIPEKYEVLGRALDYNCTRAAEVSTKINSRTLHVGEEPNPFSKFCELGCAFFYSSRSDPLHINECTDRCDEYYRYNITIGYNDLVEVARLECRDGCQIGLKRCQPGYYCSQIELKESLEDVDQDGKEIVRGFDGGLMAHCPAGTYRDVAYDAVEECIPCPPGRFREDVKGKRLEGCTKCPARTYNSKRGSDTIKDCLRCPVGTFTSEPGSATCICITPSSCEEYTY